MTEPALHAVQLDVARLGEQMLNVVRSLDDLKATTAKDSKQLFGLLEPRLNAMDRISDRQDAEITGLGMRLDARLAEVEREYTVAVEQHSHEDAPHDRSLGKRVGDVELLQAEQRGSIRVLIYLTSITLGVAATVVSGLVLYLILGK